MIQTGFFIFVVCSVIGWIWEVLLTFVMYGNLVNRGMLYGPWLPIYGVGAVAVLLIAKYGHSAGTVFLMSGLGCGFLEYMTSLVMEFVWKARWWNYGGIFSVNGRINLFVILIFGCIGLFFYYVVVPNLQWIRRTLAIPLAAITLVFFVMIAADYVYSQVHPNVAAISSHRPS